MNITIHPPRLARVAERLTYLAVGFGLAQFDLVTALAGIIAAAVAGIMAGFAFGAVVFRMDERMRIAKAKIAHVLEEL